MKSIVAVLLSVATAFALAQTAAAAELGDAAPPLQISEWVKGKPVDLAAAKGKQIVVVEFWATWCGPCRVSIPHLTEMQKKFKDVVFVGVSDEEPATVKKFVTKMGDKMDYTVAVDNDQKTAGAYMKAFGINGIPHAFIVNKEGTIVWNGHPMDNLDKTLEEIIAGKFDIEKAKKRDSARKKVEQFFELASEDGNEAKVEKLGSELEALDREIGGIEPGQTFNTAEALKRIQFQKTVMAYQAAAAKGRSEEELDKLGKQIEAVAPPQFKLADFKNDMASRKAFAAYYRAVTGGTDKEKIAKLSQAVGEMKTKSARMLNEYAWTILTDEGISTRDIPLATKLARAAVDASDAKEAGILDTYARALFDSGKASEAVDWQKKAIAAADNEETRKELEATLKKYQQKAAAKQ